MAERGILFSAPMVRALLDGRKTQTRRLIRPTEKPVKPGDIVLSWPADAFARTGARFRPRHAVGDRLWVRETYRLPVPFDPFSPTVAASMVDQWLRPNVFYEADGEIRSAGAYTGEPGKKRVSFHMPRWASRLDLEVIDVRVQRLQEITHADAIAEGVEMESADPPFFYVPGIWPHSRTAVGIEEAGGRHAERSYAKLWGELHSKPGERWQDNPWIVAYTFTVERKSIDACA